MDESPEGRGGRRDAKRQQRASAKRGGSQRLAALRERYRELALERYFGLRADPEFGETRKRWLGATGRTRGFSSPGDYWEWGLEWRKVNPSAWEALNRDADTLAQRWGLMPGHVLWGLFVEEYDPVGPDGRLFELDVWHQRVRLLASGIAGDSLTALSRAGLPRGLFVRWEADTASPDWGGRDDALGRQMELPLEYPPDLGWVFSIGNIP